MEFKKNDNSTVPNSGRIFALILVLVSFIYVSYEGCNNANRAKVNSQDIMTEERYYEEIYPKTHESYEQYKKDKEFINDLYEESQKIKERGY